MTRIPSATSAPAPHGDRYTTPETTSGRCSAMHGVSWGWFEAGFDLTRKNSNGTTVCLRSTYSKITQQSPPDYIPHHEPFQYYTPTANLRHTRPASVRMIGRNGDGANHQYDTEDFFAAVKAGNFPDGQFPESARLSGRARRLFRPVG